MKRKLFKFAVPGTVVATLATGFFIFGATSQAKEISLNIDGEVSKVETKSENVGELLDEHGVEVDENALVTPSESTALDDGETITVKYSKKVTIVADGQTLTKSVPAITVGDALDSANIPYSRLSHISEGLDSELPDSGSTIVVSNMKKIDLIDSGLKKTVISNAPTVREVLEENNVVFDSDDRINKDLDEYTKKGMSISVIDVSSKKLSSKIRSSAGTRVVETDDLPIGETEIKSEGKDHVWRKDILLTFENGIVVEREIVRTVQVSRGSKRVLLRGTGVPETVEDTPLSVPPGGACAGWQPLLDKYFGSESGTACRVMLCESGGNPKAQNPYSSASGIFQFLDGTWLSARSAVPGGEKYSRALYAPAEMQIEVAAKWLERTSWSQWECA